MPARAAAVSMAAQGGRGTVHSPLRIALFSGNYNCVRDGANQALNRLVGFLLDQPGIAVRVYSPTVARPAFAPAGDVVSVPSIPIPGRGEYRFALGVTRGVAADLDRFAPDIVHVSAPDRLGRQAQTYARKRGIPIVASLHTRFETYFDYYGLGGVRDWIERYLARFYRDCDRILVPNRPILEEFTAAGLGKRTSVWGRGVDRAIFSPHLRDNAWRRQLGYRDDEIAVLLFGRLVREKGLDTFCRVIEGARAKGHALRPLVVGDGPERARLERRMPDAAFLGYLSGPELGRAVASADIFINPSQTEAFGNVTLEAMAAGVAQIAADVPSVRALARHGHSALLVPADDTDAYVDALDRLIRSPERRRALAQAGLADAARYEWPTMLAQVAQAYRRCLAERTC